MSNGRSIITRHRGRARQRILLAGLLVAAMSLAGCPYYAPIPTPPTGSGIISDGALKSIKPGTTTRADVLLMLGDPGEREESDRFFAYHWQVSYATIYRGWIIPIQGGGTFNDREEKGLWSYHCLAVEFDPAGIVSRTAHLNPESSAAMVSCLAAWHKQGDKADS